MLPFLARSIVNSTQKFFNFPTCKKECLIMSLNIRATKDGWVEKTDVQLYIISKYACALIFQVIVLIITQKAKSSFLNMNWSLKQNQMMMTAMVMREVRKKD